MIARASKLPLCLFTADPGVPPDHLGQRYCRCGQRESHPRHDLPAVDPDLAAAERRRYADHD